MTPDDALHDEAQEQATERASAPVPAGRLVAGVWCENAPSRAEAEADLHG